MFLHFGLSRLTFSILNGKLTKLSSWHQGRARRFIPAAKIAHFLGPDVIIEPEPHQSRSVARDVMHKSSSAVSKSAVSLGLLLSNMTLWY